MPGLLDDLIGQLKSVYGPNWEGAVGLPWSGPGQQQGVGAVPGQRMPAGGQQGGLRTSADAVGMGRTGQADLTLANIGRSFGLGAGLTAGGTGALTTGLQGALSQSGIGKRFGVDNPFQTPTGSAIPSSRQLAGALSGVPQNPTSLRGALNRELQREYDRKKRESAMNVGGRMGASRSGAHGRGGFGGGGRSGASRGGSSRGARGE